MPPAPPLPVAFLPGASGRSAVWRPIAERLSKRRPPILCDYPGFADAPADPHVQSLGELYAHVLQGLPEQFDLVAMSMGGVIALRAALEQPERVRKLVLVATSGGVDITRLGGLDWREAFIARRRDLPTWFVDDRSDLTSRLAEIRIPTLLVFGDRDLIAPVAVGEFLRSRLPDARLEIVPDATHDLEEEFPDLLAALIEAHLRRA